MKKTMGFLLLLGAIIVTTKADLDFEIDLKQHFEQFSFQRYPDENNNEKHNEARDYIRRHFKDYGLMVHTQEFNTSVYVDGGDAEVMGQNIVGVMKAESESPQAVIVVGANYDTNGEDNPLFNNGAGMATLMEVARLFTFNAKWSSHYAMKYTTIFVAFDLNTREHQSSGGKPGGHYFLQEWLWPYLKYSDTNFGGAYIIDSVMNLNLDVNTQDVNSQFKQLFPETFERIQEDDNKGDFLAMVTLPEDERSEALTEQFSKSYRKDRLKRSFRLEDMTFREGMETGDILNAFTHQESYLFWTFVDNRKDNNTQISLPAVLLTDTETLRDKPILEGRPDDIFTPERQEFMECTTMALLRTLLDRQAEEITDGGAASLAIVPSFIFCLVGIVMAFRY